MLPFIRKHAATVLADLRREFNIDLMDLWRGQLSFFELCAYLAGLSPDTRTGRLMRNVPDELEGWSLVPQLLGALVDAVRNQWADKPIPSVIPKALFEATGKPEIQPDRAAMAMLGGSPDDFVKRHGGR